MKRLTLFQMLAITGVSVTVMLAGCGHDCPGSGSGLGSTCGQTGGTTGTTTASSTATTGSTGTASGELYVSSTAGNISRFADATTLNGNIAPSAVIEGASTQLTNPTRLVSDPTNDTLYVANAGNSSVLVFTGVSTQTGNLAPSRVLGGTGTQLSGPTSLALDFNHNVLYVANPTEVLAFNNASTITGVVAPARTIVGSATGFSSITSLCYDANNDVLYVVDGGANSIFAFQTASSVTGNAYPNRTLAGSATQISSPEDAILDGTRMYISNGSGSILHFENVTTITGNVAPTAVISGQATSLDNPTQMAIHSGYDELYVNNVGNDSVLIFASASTLSGAAPPTRVLYGTGTELTSTSGLAVDFTH